MTVLTPLPLPCSGHTAVHAHTAQVSLPGPDVTLKRESFMWLCQRFGPSLSFGPLPSKAGDESSFPGGRGRGMREKCGKIPARKGISVHFSSL